MAMRFQNKVALVTGGASGIGKEVATRFVAEGGSVLINGRDGAKAEAVAREIDPTGKRVAVHAGDIALPATGEAVVKTAIDRFGRLDVLFNNAGIFAPKPFLEVDEAEYDRFLDVILKGKFFAAQAAAKAMKASGRGGAIVQTGSMWALQAIGATPSAAYSAAKAGVMAANGHLIDQFLQDNSNKRTDRYGGTIENRARLLFEVVEVLVSVWGADRVGVRIAPSGTFNGMADSNPRALFRYVAERLNDFKLAYLHVIEPRIKGGELIAEGQGPVAAQELSKVFHGPIIAAGGFEPNTAEATVANGDASLIAFGRHFIANPDLPKRIELGLPLNRYDRSTFYAFDARGYTDYPEYEVHEADQAFVD